MKWTVAFVLCVLQALAPALHAHVGGDHPPKGPHLHDVEIAIPDHQFSELSEAPGLEVGIALSVPGRPSIDVQTAPNAADPPTAHPNAGGLAACTPAQTSQNPFATTGSRIRAEDHRLPATRAPPLV